MQEGLSLGDGAQLEAARTLELQAETVVAVLVVDQLRPVLFVSDEVGIVELAVGESADPNSRGVGLHAVDNVDRGTEVDVEIQRVADDKVCR
jgi:hypothetical protein